MDERTPVSVTWIGIYKVTIFDQEAYDASIQRYDAGKDTAPAPGAQIANGASPPHEKKKRIAAYKWISEGVIKKTIAS